MEYVNALTARAIKHPVIGDEFTEMMSFWIVVAAVDDENELVVTCSANAPARLPADGEWRVETWDAFASRLSYDGSGIGAFWVRHVDNKADVVSAWQLPEDVKNAFRSGNEAKDMEKTRANTLIFALRGRHGPIYCTTDECDAIAQAIADAWNAEHPKCKHIDAETVKLTQASTLMLSARRAAELDRLESLDMDGLLSRIRSGVITSGVKQAIFANLRGRTARRR